MPILQKKTLSLREVQHLSPQDHTLCEQQSEGEKITCIFSFLNKLLLVPGKTYLACVNCQDSADIAVQSNFLPRMREMSLFRKDTISV